MKMMTDKQEAAFWKEHCLMRKQYMKEQERAIFFWTGITLVLLILLIVMVVTR